MARLAVVLFNLGGPNDQAAVRPFLFNLFSDPAIIALPAPLRWLLAWLISHRRAPKARAIYARIGGGSPLLEQTEAQARALERALSDIGEARAFIAMRYWHPRAAATATAIAAFAPDEIVALPLYPQFSTTTTASSLAEWRAAATAAGIRAPTRIVDCYPSAPGLIAAHAAHIGGALDRLAAIGRPRLLFSAHGLPEKVIAGGDPYQWQVERSAAAVVHALHRPGLDWAVCYQSRVGPLRWIGPAIDDEVRRAGRDQVPLVVCPIAFVSEHSETLVELDMDYRDLAERVGVLAYERVPTVGTDRAFIEALATIVRRARGRDGPCSDSGRRVCPATYRACPCRIEGGGDDV